MIEIPPNELMKRLQYTVSDDELPDEWKAVLAMTEDQAKIYRTKATLLKFEGEFKFCTLRIEGVIPVYSDSKVIGCLGEVNVEGEEVTAEIIIDYSTPERLELQTGSPDLWADGLFVINSWNESPLGKQYTSATLKSVDITKIKPTETNIPPIGKV